MLACSDPQRDRNGQRSLEARLPERSLARWLVRPIARQEHRGFISWNKVMELD